MKSDSQTALTEQQAEDIALTLDVKRKEVLVMEERMYGQETSLDTSSANNEDDDNSFTPADWLSRESDDPKPFLKKRTTTT